MPSGIRGKNFFWNYFIKNLKIFFEVLELSKLFGKGQSSVPGGAANPKFLIL